MIKKLINLGLLLTPFVFWKGMDLRTPKEIASFGIALALGLFALYSGGLKKFRNHWLLMLMGFFLISMLFSPSLNFLLAFKEGNRVSFLMNRQISGFWVFKAFLYALVYLLMTISVASVEFKVKDIQLILKIMAGAGLIMAVYIFIQHFGLDQFFQIRTDEEQVAHVTKATLGGFIGQPTTCAPFIAMIVPVAIYLRKYIFALCMIVAVYLTKSEMSMGAMAVGTIGYLCISGRKFNKIIGIGIIILSILAGTVYMNKHRTFNPIEFVMSHSSGRTEAWAAILKDYSTKVENTDKKYTVTGLGPGAFEYTHSVRKNNRWRQAHSEPIELLYNFGIIGLSLFMLALWKMVKDVYSHCHVNEYVYCLLGSLLVILTCSLGSFPFHIGTTMFYTAIIVGMLHNERVLLLAYDENIFYGEHYDT